MEVEISSFESIEQRSDFAPHTALISIGDPDAPPPRLRQRPEHFLRLVFDDMTPETAVEWLELPKGLLETPEELYRRLLRYNTFLFTDKMADRAAAFILKNAPTTEKWICQCEFGQSRSAAFAAAIREYFLKDEESIFRDIRYQPNKYIYEKLLGALEKMGGKGEA